MRSKSNSCNPGDAKRISQRILHSWGQGRGRQEAWNLTNTVLMDDSTLQTQDRFIVWLEWDLVTSGLPGYIREKTLKQCSTEVGIYVWMFV